MSNFLKLKLKLRNWFLFISFIILLVLKLQSMSHMQDLAFSIQRGSLDWERALRCLRHALRATPSPEWWRRSLLIVPSYRPQAPQSSIPGAVFSPEMVCEAVIDRTVELLKSTNSGSTAKLTTVFHFSA